MEQSYSPLVSPPDPGTNKLLLLELVLGVVVLVLLFMWWYSGSSDRGETAQQPQATVPASALPQSQGLGSAISEQVKNPGAELADINPFKTPDNPFAGIYENPFQ